MPHIETKLVTFQAAAAAAQTLPENAVYIASILVGEFAVAPAVFQDYTVGTAAPAGTVAQFTGTPAAPSNTITFAAALAATDTVTVSYVPEGGLPSNL